MCQKIQLLGSMNWVWSSSTLFAQTWRFENFGLLLCKPKKNLLWNGKKHAVSYCLALTSNDNWKNVSIGSPESITVIILKFEQRLFSVQQSF